MTPKKLKFALIIPTLNAEKDNWEDVLLSINNQTIKPELKFILDSCSQDNTVCMAEKHGFTHIQINKGSFNHATTRKKGIDLVKNKVDIAILMTQDAHLACPDSFKFLLNSFNDEKVAVAYGRQLPRHKATPIETFARLYNYPNLTVTRTLSDKNTLGMKVAFCSDSFSAYRTPLIINKNLFPDRSIVGEDYITAANSLLKGFKVHYAADATVLHSHDYSLIEEFKRYFDIGVFHQEYSHIISQLGSTERSGSGFVKAEILYLLKHKPSHIPLAIIRTLSKYAGYISGKHYKHINSKIIKKLSMHSFYFNK